MLRCGKEEMPIKPGFHTQRISCDDFHALDYEVMGIVFSIHRDLGRFWNEKIYQNELAYRCQKTHLLNSNVAFKITTVTKDEKSNENHLRRFIRYTSLKAIHWINFDHDRVIFKTILQ